MALAVAACKVRKAPESALLAYPERPASAAVFEYMELARQAVDEQFERARIDLSANLVSVNYLELAQLTGAYAATIRQQGDGPQQREDRWRLNTDILPGAVFQQAAASTLPIAIRLRGGRDLSYIRMFPDKTAALKARPVLPHELPFDATRALAMRPGDFASLPVSMGLALGLETGAGIQPFAVSAGTGVFWNGEFRFNVIRLEGNHVRLKVAPMDVRGWQAGAAVGASLDMFGYGPFELVNLDRQAERLLGFDFLRFSTTRITRGEQMAIDYLFDLAHPDAALAYNAVLQHTVRLKATALAGQALRNRIDQTRIFADLTPAEYLHAADDSRPAEQKRVARVYRGARLYSGAMTDFRFGARPLRWSGNSSLTLNWLRASTGSEPARNLVHHLFSTGRKQSSWFSPLREHHQMTAAAVSHADDRWETLTFRDLSFVWTYSESELSGNERNDIRAATKAVLGDFYDHIRADQVLLGPGGSRYTATVRLGLQPDLFATMRATAARDPELYEKQLWYVLWLITPRFEGRYGPRTSGAAADPLGLVRNFFNNSLQAIRSAMRSLLSLRWEGVHGATVREIIERSQQLDRVGETAYLEALFRLLERDESAQEIIPAFLLTLAQAYRLQPFVEVTATDKAGQPLQATFGQDTGGPDQALARDAFYRITHTGYER